MAEFEATGTGYDGEIQEWTAPETGTYRIFAAGARGGGRWGGKGAKAAASFHIEEGETLEILCGHKGLSPSDNGHASGGGGTFVVKKDATDEDGIFVIAGGGGASDHNPDGTIHEQHGRTGTKGGEAIQDGSGGTGTPGEDGDGGTGDSTAYGGAGFHGDGDGSAKAYLNGGQGCTDGDSDTYGGFGGGGSSNNSGWERNGGGGGYSGGAGARGNGDYAIAGGGGSYNAGDGAETIEGDNDGDGWVEIVPDEWNGETKQRTPHQISVEWAPPYTGDGIPAEQFHLTLQDADGEEVDSVTLDGDEYRHTFDGLDPETDYTVEIVAEDQDGEESDPFTFDASTYADEAPEDTPNVSASRDGSYVEVTWTGVEGAERHRIRALDPFQREVALEHEPADIGQGQVTRLLPGPGPATYTFGVRAENEAGAGTELTDTAEIPANHIVGDDLDVDLVPDYPVPDGEVSGEARVTQERPARRVVVRRPEGRIVHIAAPDDDADYTAHAEGPVYLEAHGFDPSLWRGAWKPETEYQRGDVVFASEPSDTAAVLQAETSGTTGDEEPDWPGHDDTVEDGGVTWRSLGDVRENAPVVNFYIAPED